MSVIPGGHLTRSKKVFPFKAVSGHGAYVVIDDGREMLDMLAALGARTLSNDQRVGPSGVLSASYVDETQAADAVLKHVAPWASSVRFVRTGSEALHAAYRIAKATTGRSKVLMGNWSYHGWHEWCSPPRFVCVHNEPVTSTGWDSELAAVFIEPHRWEPVDVEWLRSVRAFCDRVGALLVFDSMIFGGRFALGGASEYFGVQPDLECFGKAFGNGESVAFVVGNESLEQHGELVSGTYSGDVGGLRAVMDTLEVYANEPVIETLWMLGRDLQDGLRQVLPSDLAVCEGQPVHQRIRFFNEAHGQRFAEAMWARGILYHPGVMNVMYAHTPAMIDRVIQAAAESVRTL